MKKIYLLLIFIQTFHILGAQSFSGGEGDGFGIGTFNFNNSFLYVGGQGDGFAKNIYNFDNSFLYQGGEADGFALAIYIPAIVYPCSYVTNTWTGTNGDWTNPLNWSSGTVPDICHEVTIGAVHVVDIPPGENALARTLNLQGSLQIANSGSLHLDGQDTTGNIIVIQGGLLTNSGALSLENYASGSISRSGIRITSNGRFINNNYVSIDSIGSNTSHGIHVVNGSYKNNSSSSNTIIQHGVFATGYGIRNSDSLINEGSLTINQFDGLGGLFNQSHFDNSGLLTIQSSRGGVLNQDSIFNDGIMHVDSITEFNGFKNSRVDAYLHNNINGDISISRVLDAYSFDNISRVDNNGIIDIQNVTIGGIFDQNGTWNNNYNLILDYSTGFGFRLDNTTVNNQGSIQITDNSNGMFDALINTGGSSIINFGTIEVISGN